MRLCARPPGAAIWNGGIPSCQATSPPFKRSRGMSAAGRFVRTAICPGSLNTTTVDWPTQPATCRIRVATGRRRMYGGVNASVPNSISPRQSRGSRSDGQALRFWLLSNGCHGLAVLDKAGEVASLPIAEQNRDHGGTPIALASRRPSCWPVSGRLPLADGGVSPHGHTNLRFEASC